MSKLDDAASLIVLQPRTETHYVDRTVTVNRAPTDESVKLLKEMEKAAQDKVIESVKVGDTHFECVVHVWREMESDDQVYRAIFSLNGKKLTAEHRIWRGDVAKNRWAGIDGLRNDMAKVIAGEVLVGALQSLAREGGI